MVDVRYWVAGNQAFGYTPHRQADGKFYALKYRAMDRDKSRFDLVKKRSFGRRKKAKETAYHWYTQRRAVLEKLATKRAAKSVKPLPTKAEITQQKLAKVEESIKRLMTKKKRLETMLKKQLRRRKYYQKQLEKEK